MNKNNINISKLTTETFNELSEQQDVKGLQKYKQPINPLDDYNWNDMISEELVDALRYTVASRKKTEIITQKVIQELESIRYEILFNDKKNNNKQSINISFCIEQLEKLNGGNTNKYEK